MLLRLYPMLNTNGFFRYRSRKLLPATNGSDNSLTPYLPKVPYMRNLNYYQSVEIYRNLYKSVDKKNDLKIN